MSGPITLRGIAWNHSRGFLPVIATAQRFEELHPEISICWEKRSLQSFADASLETLAESFDLIVMDHPHTALAATQGLVLPLDDWLPTDFLADQERNSVGGSHASYRFNGKQWALATDAAAPIATYRPDLVSRLNVELPRTWPEVLDFAARGYVTLSAFPVDVLMHTYTFCDALGHSPFTSAEFLAPNDVVAAALTEFTRLVSLCDPVCLTRNPIRTAEWMTTTDDPRATYCPFAYGYSNYSRPGYAVHPLKATGLVTFGGRRLRSTLGGAGIAVSARTKHPQACTDYARFTATPIVQRTLYFQAGGQPGHRSAWLDDTVNHASLNFFRDTLQTLDEAILRGQFPGYMKFQDEGTPIAHACICGETPPERAASELNELYKSYYSLQHIA